MTAARYDHPATALSDRPIRNVDSPETGVLSDDEIVAPSGAVNKSVAQQADPATGRCAASETHVTCTDVAAESLLAADEPFAPSWTASSKKGDRRELNDKDPACREGMDPMSLFVVEALARDCGRASSWTRLRRSGERA